MAKTGRKQSREFLPGALGKSIPNQAHVFSQIFNDWLELRGYKKSDPRLSELLGVPRATIQAIADGANPTLETVSPIIATVAGGDAAAFFARDRGSVKPIEPLESDERVQAQFTLFCELFTPDERDALLAWASRAQKRGPTIWRSILDVFDQLTELVAPSGPKRPG